MELLSVLTSGELDRISELSPERVERYLAGRSLVRELAARQLHRQWHTVIPEACCTECGADHGAITVKGSDLKVSVSYSGDHAVAIAAHGRNVGIDLESGNPRELREVGVKQSTASVTLQEWCEYEAVIKADGRGMLVDIADLSISEEHGEKLAQVRGSAQAYRFIPVEAPVGFVVSAVVEIIQD